MESDAPHGGHPGHWGARVLILMMLAAFCGLGIEAAAEAHVLVKSNHTQPAQVSPAVSDASASEAPPVEQLVWRGADLDGDGQPDIANPTGKGVRGCDEYGCGKFGSVRDAGGRRHEGVDFLASAGQLVDAPISGYVRKIGYAYPGDQRYLYVDIENPALHFEARVFYVRPLVREGQAVRVGQPIGDARSLEARYPGITNHVHVELGRIGGRKLDAMLLLKPALEPVQSGDAMADGGGSTPTG